MAKGWMKKFYKSKEWRKKRPNILQRDNSECQMCKKHGKFSKAEVVHHIKHLDKFPDLALVDSNLLSLCGACHNKVHPEKLKRNYAGRKKYFNKEKW